MFILNICGVLGDSGANLLVRAVFMLFPEGVPVVVRCAEITGEIVIASSYNGV